MNDNLSAASETSTQTGYVKYYVLGAAAFLVVLFAYVLFGGSKGTSQLDQDNNKEKEKAELENPFQEPRVSLNRTTELNTCREALSQINQHLSKHPATDLWRLTPAEKAAISKLPDTERQAVWKDALQAATKEMSAAQNAALAGLSDDQRERLRKAVERALTGETASTDKDGLYKELGLELEPFAFSCSNTFRAAFLKRQFNLRDDEWAEVNSGTFTLLDGHHLDVSFLLRDVAGSFTRDYMTSETPPLQQAAAAFAWTMRNVRLIEGKEGESPLPPGFVLRRGQGTVVERALVFLALRQQFDLPGCLLALPEEQPGKSLLWTCGVLVDQQIYLFDPRMSLPVPGANGEGIATLADVQSKPELLQQLAPGYDVTMEQARKVQLLVACPLSALAPRMRYLERVLQNPDVPAPVVGGRLSFDAAHILAEFERAATPAGSSVKGWQTAVRQLRQLLPTDEGGVDKEQHWRKLSQMLIPLNHYPNELREKGRISLILLQRFGTPFIDFALAPDQPRDLLLRGRFNEASSQLTNIRQEVIKRKQRFAEEPDLLTQVNGALRILIDAQAGLQKLEEQAKGNPADPNLQEAREKMDKLWKQALATLDIYLQGIAAGPRGVEVNYQLALCKHEQAERLQVRLDEARRTRKNVPPSEVEEVRSAWQNAAEWWTTFAQEYGDAPGAATARLPASRARLMLGERDAAIELLKDTSGKLTDVEKAGRLFLARQLEKK
jgi:hypothetical protein